MNKASNLALASIFLYLALAITCLYFALCFYDFKTGEFRDGRYSAPKFIFFVVLFFSAILDIPLFIGCIAEGGPHDCEWEDPSYVVFWLFHLIATCGYIYAIITPAVLWSDIIYQKDGMFWNSAYPVDSTKLFFRVAFLLFCANEFTTVIGAVVMQDPSHFGSFDTNSIGAITDCITPIMTTIITFGCLWSGIELQRYVVNVGLGGGTRNRVLMQLNLTMFLIAATYMYRSLLVLSLYDPIPQQYKDAMHPIRSSFFLWLLGTRWLPAVVCSFCLVNEMRFKGSASSNSRHSQNAIIRASKDEGEHTLYQSLLRAVGATNRSSTNSTYFNNSTHVDGRRTMSVESGCSASTSDSVIRDSYSMLSSVDFPDSSSETSSTYIFSPVDSPERAKAEDVLIHSHHNNSSSNNTSTHSRGNTNNNTTNKNNNNVSSREAERIARKHRKSLQQLNTHSSSVYGNNSSIHSNNTTHNAIYTASVPRTHNTNNTNTINNTNNTYNSNINNNINNNTAHPSRTAPTSLDSPHYLSRATSSSSEADFYQYSSSRTTSIDHFFTFAAPNLNLSNIGGGSGGGNVYSGSVYGGSSGVPPLPSGRSPVGNTTGPAHIQHTLNSNSGSYTNNNNVVTNNVGTSNIATSNMGTSSVGNSASNSPHNHVLAASPTTYSHITDHTNNTANNTHNVYNTHTSTTDMYRSGGSSPRNQYTAEINSNSL